MSTQREVIQAFMKSLDKTKKYGEDALNQAIKACSTFKNFAEIKEALINDCKNARSVNDFLKNYCGIDFDTEDSGAITGSEAGGAQIKNDADTILEGSNLNTKFTNNSFTVNYLNVELADGKTFSDLTTTEQFIWQGLYTWWVEGALNLIADSFGEAFSFGKKSTATTDKLYIEFIDEDNDTPVHTTASAYANGEASELKLTINMHYYESLEDDLVRANTEFDRTIAHELAYAVMYANLLYEPLFTSLAGFVMEGLAEVVVGIKNTHAEGIKNLASDVTNFEIGLDVNNLVKDEDFMSEVGFIFFRYLAKQSSDIIISNSTADTLIQTYRGNDVIENFSSGVTITSGLGNDSISIKTNGEKINISAGEGNDSIALYENTKRTTVDGGEGKDYVYLHANTTNNTIKSGEGNDTVYSEGANASINADEGNDTVLLLENSTKNTVNGGAGKDSIYSNGENAAINSGDGNDYVYFYSTATKNALKGGKGNDSIYSEAENTSIEADEGNDTVFLLEKSSKDTVDSGEGKDSIYSGGIQASIDAGDDDDYIHLYSYAKGNTVRGGAGDDLIVSNCANGVMYKYTLGDGNDVVKGFSEKDTLSISSEISYVSVTSGSDVIVTVKDGKITLEGAAELASPNIVLTVTDSDTSPVEVSSLIKTIDASERTKAVVIAGNALDNSIKGGSSDDTISGGSGNDKLYGNAGNDSLLGGNGNDSLSGGAGNDKLYGNNGNDYIQGGDGNDSMSGGAGADKLYGNNGNDYIQGNDGNDSISGGAGNDKIYGNAGNDYIRGDDGKDSISGGAGADKIYGNAGNDYIQGDDGNDSISGGDGADKIYGNAGNDYIQGDTGNDTVSGGLGNDRIYGNDGNDYLHGNDGNDTISGGNGNDKLYGDDGNDSLVGGNGNDYINGGTGADRLYGNAGDDSLIGGAGDDILRGGAGNDSLWGDAGADTFIYASGEGNDIIYGFANDDLLQITGTFSTSYNKTSKEIYFKVGSTDDAITLKNFTASSFNINGTAYKISGSTLVKK